MRPTLTDLRTGEPLVGSDYDEAHEDWKDVEYGVPEAESVTKYLRQMAAFYSSDRFATNEVRADWMFRSVEELVLHYGRPFRPGPRPEGIEQGEIKACFSNSMELAIERTDLIYVEGFANTRFFPMPHGWLSTDGHTAIDPTWEDGTEYFGIPFTQSFWRAYVVKAGYWGVLFPQLPHKHLVDLLKNGLPAGAIEPPDPKER